MHKPNPISRLFVGIWNSLNFLRRLIANLILLLLIIFCIKACSSALMHQKSAPKPRILVMDLEGMIVDEAPNPKADEYQRIKQALGDNEIDLNRRNSLYEMTKLLEHATNDRNIKGLVLKLDNFTGADLPSLRYLSKYLQRFKAAHKTIYAISNQYNQQQYYLASNADQIYLAPQGSVSLFGLATSNLYYKKMLDKLDLDTYIFRVGRYKSAVEPFTRNDMSADARANTERWLKLMWHNYLQDIAKQRDQSATQLVPDAQTYLAKLREVNGDQTEYALKQHLIDDVADADEFDDLLSKKFGDNTGAISIYDYKDEWPQDNQLDATTEQIGVIVVDGTIADGESSQGIAGSYTISEQLRQILDLPQIKAVVLRINSPGGSVTGSEEIRSAIHALRKQHIPVVVSMGGMAASGGYWIATESDYIFADANTLTGSIGIFGVIPNATRALDNLGINSDGVSTSPLAGANLTQPLSDEFKEMMQLSIENGYQRFLQLVSKSRKLPLEYVDEIAQGQVWLGQEANKNNLVDMLGDFDSAVSKAAKLAHLQDYELNWFAPKLSLFDSLWSGLSVYLPQSLTKTLLNQSVPVQLQQQLSLWSKMQDPQSRYVYCLNCGTLQ